MVKGLAVLLAAVAWSMGAGAGASAQSYVPRNRTYYVAADEVVWNYAPTGRNQITGRRFGPMAAEFTRHTRTHIGKRYVKALYHQYTDASFTARVRRAPAERYLGFLGPVVRAVVGDTVTFVFRNRTHHPLSVHMHGLRYDKASEGAPYADGATVKADDAVPPGATHTYRYDVAPRAGPGPADPSSVLWMYHSHTREVADTNAGLVGPVIVTRADAARPDGTPLDVDREVIADYTIEDENLSPYLHRNIRRSLPRAVWRGHTGRLIESPDFQESNLKHTINGYLYGNGPAIDVPLGGATRWYLMDMGNEADMHTPHWHGNTVLWNGMRTDVIPLAPAVMTSADMVADDPGRWLFHCHVNDHIRAGMQTLYRVAGGG